MTTALWRTELDIGGLRRGKVRDVYDLGDTLLIVACDRLSAYDHVLETPIPDKGKILNQLTNYWFEELDNVLPHHLLASEVEDFPQKLEPYRDQLAGRAVIAKKASVIPFECVVRGYLAGSAFREYKKTGRACGHDLGPGLVRASRLEEPIFTPTTKADEGHDEPVDFDHLVTELGAERAETLRDLTLELFRRAARHAEAQGLILADTKFEFGTVSGRDETETILWIDEALTPDSSRYWEQDAWTPGTEPVSFDKQYVRNWLDASGWDHESAPPALPDEVVAGTRERYLEAFRRLTGKDPVL